MSSHTLSESSSSCPSSAPVLYDSSTHEHEPEPGHPTFEESRHTNIDANNNSNGNKEEHAREERKQEQHQVTMEAQAAIHRSETSPPATHQQPSPQLQQTAPPPQQARREGETFGVVHPPLVRHVSAPTESFHSHPHSHLHAHLYPQAHSSNLPPPSIPAAVITPSAYSAASPSIPIGAPLTSLAVSSSSSLLSASTGSLPVQPQSVLPVSSHPPPPPAKTRLVLEESPDRQFARYKKQLGSGTFKDVYLGIDTESGKEVAWNVVDLTKVNMKDSQRIKHEIELLKSLRHPNILQIFDSWEDVDNKKLVFITERLNNTLKQHIHRLHPMKPKVIKKYCRQILTALKYLHSGGGSGGKPIIHRDIKSDNIFCSSATGDVVLGDFGLSIAKDVATSLVGTPGFLAPEVFNDSYNELVDIWGVGMTCFEMATNSYPYVEANGVVSVLLKKGFEGIKPEGIEQIQDPQLKEFILMCLQPVERRPSAQQLLEQKVYDLSEEPPKMKAVAPIIDGMPPNANIPTLPAASILSTLPPSSLQNSSNPSTPLVGMEATSMTTSNINTTVNMTTPSLTSSSSPSSQSTSATQQLPHFHHKALDIVPQSPLPSAALAMAVGTPNGAAMSNIPLSTPPASVPISSSAVPSVAPSSSPSSAAAAVTVTVATPTTTISVPSSSKLKSDSIAKLESLKRRADVLIPKTAVAKTDNPAVVSIFLYTRLKDDIASLNALLNEAAASSTPIVHDVPDLSTLLLIDIPSYDFARDNYLVVATSLVRAREDLLIAAVELENLEEIIASKIEESVREKYNKFTQKARTQVSSEIMSLLTSLGMNLTYANAFIEQEVSYEDLFLLSDADLSEFIPKLGPRRRLQQFLDSERAARQKKATAAVTASLPIPTPIPATAAAQTKFSDANDSTTVSGATTLTQEEREKLKKKQRRESKGDTRIVDKERDRDRDRDRDKLKSRSKPSSRLVDDLDDENRLVGDDTLKKRRSKVHTAASSNPAVAVPSKNSSSEDNETKEKRTIRDSGKSSSTTATTTGTSIRAVESTKPKRLLVEKRSDSPPLTAHHQLRIQQPSPAAQSPMLNTVDSASLSHGVGASATTTAAVGASSKKGNPSTSAHSTITGATSSSAAISANGSSDHTVKRITLPPPVNMSTVAMAPPVSASATPVQSHSVEPSPSTHVASNPSSVTTPIVSAPSPIPNSNTCGVAAPSISSITSTPTATSVATPTPSTSVSKQKSSAKFFDSTSSADVHMNALLSKITSQLDSGAQVSTKDGKSVDHLNPPGVGRSTLVAPPSHLAIDGSPQPRRHSSSSPSVPFPTANIPTPNATIHQLALAKGTPPTSTLITILNNRPTNVNNTRAHSSAFQPDLSPFDRLVSSAPNQHPKESSSNSSQSTLSPSANVNFLISPTQRVQ